MIRLALLVLALADQNPEAVYRIVPETLRNAKTVNVKYAFNMTSQIEDVATPISLKGSGILLLKEGNRARLEVRDDIAGKRIFLLISDGSKMRIQFEDWAPEVTDTPKTLNAQLVSLLCREGIYAARFHYRRKIVKVPPFKMSDFTSRKDGQTNRTLSFRMTRDNRIDDVTIRFVPQSSRFLKRTARFRIVATGMGSLGNSVETYDVFRLGGDIPDEKFSLGE